MQTFGPLHLIVIIMTVVIGGGLIFKGTGVETAPSLSRTQSPSPATLPVRPVGTPTIVRAASDIPPAITRTTNETVKINLESVQVVGQIADGITYEYWTFNRTVPGPFIRVLEGDMVEVTLTHKHDHVTDAGSEAEEESIFHSFAIDAFVNEANAQGVSQEVAEHMAAGHAEHSIDLHATQGAKGGADASRVGPNETKTFTFRADKAGIYVYHCGSAHVPTHIANGMYGLILVEPKGGLPPVDHEYYIAEGELYTTGALGEKGHQDLSRAKLLAEDPEYIVFNGKPGALTGANALTAKVGETVRLFVAASGQVTSNFHVIGEVFDRVYREGDLLSPPARNVQTTAIPAGGAAVVEFDVNYPGTYVLVDHALSRAVDRGAAGHLIVTGDADPEVFDGTLSEGDH